MWALPAGPDAFGKGRRSRDGLVDKRCISIQTLAYRLAEFRVELRMKPKMPMQIAGKKCQTRKCRELSLGQINLVAVHARAAAPNIPHMADQ